MAGRNPAQLFGLADTVGELKAGDPANFMLYTLAEGKPVIEKVVIRGKERFLRT